MEYEDALRLSCTFPVRPRLVLRLLSLKLPNRGDQILNFLSSKIADLCNFLNLFLKKNALGMLNFLKKLPSIHESLSRDILQIYQIHKSLSKKYRL